ncbi:hypothetical protein GF340_00385 [Candidatus Peregrinibacteria bacterium]|nr:hypothetical protein [Candidatus Peregrinibacteria bacterium]
MKTSKSGLSALKVAKWLCGLLLIILPFQIGDLIHNPDIFTEGKFMVSDVFKLHFQDILICLTILFLGIAGWKKQWDFKISNQLLGVGKWLFIVLVMMLFINTFHHATITLMALRYALLFTFFYIVGSKLYEKEQIIKFLLIGLLFQFAIGLYQLLFQDSLGLRLLGEPYISSNNMGLASLQVMGYKIIRPYGTLAHANILAGFFLVGFILSRDFIQKNSVSILYKIGCFVMIIGVFMTFSRQAILALIAVLLVDILSAKKRNLWHWILAFIVIVPGILLISGRYYFEVFNDAAMPEAFSERILFIKSAFFMIWDNFFIGIGGGNFVNELQNYVSLKLAPWQLQPVHNVFLLWMVEYGAIFGSFIIFLWIRLIKAALYRLKNMCSFSFNVVLGLTIIMFFDHYLITNYEGQLLLFLILGLTTHVLNNDAFPAKNS